MSGPLIGDAGADHILTALSSTRHPLQFIEEFQQANGLNPSNDMPLLVPPLTSFCFLNIPTH